MDQQEIDTIKQIAKNLSADLQENSRNVPFSDVTEYIIALNQQIQVFFVERRAHAIAANNVHRRTIFKTEIPKTDLQIERVSIVSRLLNNKSQSKYKVVSPNEKLRDNIIRNEEIQKFLNENDYKLSVRTKDEDTHSLLELRHNDFILNQDFIQQSTTFIQNLREIIEGH